MSTSEIHGPCPFCDKDVTGTEYNRSHFGGKCKRNVGKAANADWVKTMGAILKAKHGIRDETEAERYQRLADSTNDKEIAAHYRAKAAAVSKQQGERVAR
jgi:hypothetical protein